MRDDKFDIIKGMAIILMVLGHALESGCVREFIYLFHIPVFFVVAGWFYREVGDGGAVVRDIGRKTLRIWWPFVFWALALILCHNALLSMGVYAADSGLDTIYARQGMTVHWDAREILNRCVYVPIMFKGATGLGAPYWFLEVLFASLVLYRLCDFAVSRFTRHRLLALTLLALMLALLGRYGHGKLLQVMEDRFCIRQTFTAFMLLHLGVLLRSGDFRLERLGRRGIIVAGTVGFLALCAMMLFGRVELVTNAYPSIASLILSSVAGWYMLYALSLLFPVALGPVAYVGRHTLAILLLHLLAFKVQDFLVIHLTQDDVSVLSRPVVSYTGGMWAILYTMIGVCLPLGLNALWWRLWRRMRSFSSE